MSKPKVQYDEDVMGLDTKASIAEQLRVEKAKVTRKMTARIREIDTAIRMLENSDAEAIVKESQAVLDKGAFD